MPLTDLSVVEPVILITTPDESTGQVSPREIAYAVFHFTIKETVTSPFFQTRGGG